MIFDTSESHTNGLKKLAKGKPESVLIATYGVYAGILHDGDDSHKWGGKYENGTHELLDQLIQVPEVKILVGFSGLKLCRSDCEDCLAVHYKQAMRLDQHRQKWPQFEWRYTEDFHLKAFLFYYKRGCIGVSGGRNLSSSEWTDASFILNNEQADAIRVIFDHSWKIAKQATMENLERTIELQMP